MHLISPARELNRYATRCLDRCIAHKETRESLYVQDMRGCVHCKRAGLWISDWLLIFVMLIGLSGHTALYWTDRCKANWMAASWISQKKKKELRDEREADAEMREMKVQIRSDLLSISSAVWHWGKKAKTHPPVHVWLISNIFFIIDDVRLSYYY